MTGTDDPSPTESDLEDRLRDGPVLTVSGPTEALLFQAWLEERDRDEQ